jgi:hypothetical protein
MRTFLNSSIGRSLVALVIVAVALVIFLVIQSSRQLPVKTFSFSKDGVNFGYNYPADFTETVADTTHDVANLNETGFNVSKRYTDAKENSEIVRLSFQPLNNENDISNVRTFAKEGLEGNKYSLSRFTSSLSITVLADCTTNSLLTSSSGQHLLQCKLNSAYGDTRSGAVIFAVNDKGLCSLEYNLSKAYWDSHSKDWPILFKSLKCS